MNKSRRELAVEKPNKPMAKTGLRGSSNSNQLYWAWLSNVVKNWPISPAASCKSERLAVEKERETDRHLAVIEK